MNQKVLAVGLIAFATMFMLQLSETELPTAWIVGVAEKPANLTVDYSDGQLKAIYASSNGLIPGAECTVRIGSEEFNLFERTGYYYLPLPDNKYEVEVTCHKQGFEKTVKPVTTK